MQCSSPISACRFIAASTIQSLHYWLDLSFNSLRHIPNVFESLTQLNTLNLQANEIAHLNELTYFKYCACLTDLNLCANPILFAAAFSNLCLSIVPSLQILNNERVDHLNSNEKSPTHNSHLIQLCCANSYSDSKTSVFHDHASCRLTQMTPLNFDAYKDEIIYLNLSRCKLLFVPPVISELPRLQALDLSHNFLLQIKSLHNNERLKELVLTANHLTSLHGLSGLHAECKLSKLDMDNNSIVDLAPLSKYCTHLKYVSFACNKVRTVGVLQSMRDLRQINAGYNCISHSNDIYVLSKSHNCKVAILDLTGNAICHSMRNYRLYTIFCLSHSLRMLDGASIANTEIDAARKLYDGRLHFDLLLDKTGCGHSDFAGVERLQLSACNLSVLDGNVLHPLQFSNIKELELSHNNLGGAEMSAVLRLKTLLRLNLSHNQIDAIYALDELPDLQQLVVSHNNIQTISSLHLCGLQHLSELKLDHNNIVHVDGLLDLPSLRTLHLDANRIREIAATAFVGVQQSLTELSLNDNGLRSLQNLQMLRNLSKLSVANNRISNRNELELKTLLQSMPCLRQLSLHNNPIEPCLDLDRVVQYSESIQFVGHTDVTQTRQKHEQQPQPQPQPQPVQQEKDPSSSSSLYALQKSVGLNIKPLMLTKKTKI